MNRGLRPILDELRFNGCPLCEESLGMIHVNGSEEIVLVGCGHVLDAKEWADEQYKTEWT